MILALLITVLSAVMVFFALRTKRETIEGVQSSYIERIRKEVSLLLPETGDLSRYSIKMADARHTMESTEDTETFMSALEYVCSELPGFYSSLGSEEASLRSDQALSNLSKLF